jgi:hypothetical protein
MLNLLLGPVSSIVKDAVGGYVQTKKAKLEQKVTKINAETDILKKQISGEIQYDVEAIKGAKDSFKDEWILILWSIPMVMIWIPPLQVYVEAGFLALKDSVPQWYFYTWGAIVSASYGTKSALKFFKK